MKLEVDEALISRLSSEVDRYSQPVHRSNQTAKNYVRDVGAVLFRDVWIAAYEEWYSTTVLLALLLCACSGPVELRHDAAMNDAGSDTADAVSSWDGCIPIGIFTCPGAADAADAVDAVDAGPSCVDTLSNVAQGDFTISFSITTTTTQPSTIASQRASCDATRPFWDLSLNTHTAGAIVIEMNGGSATSTRTVNDGSPHAVVIQRRSLDVSIFIDGMASGSMILGASLDSLVPLVIASGNPCESPGGRMPLAGTVGSFCMERF